MAEPGLPYFARPRPSLGEIFSTWFVVGIQSFGGGSATFFLIHQACIDHGWLEEDEFIRAWALAQISPGINLLKLTVLVGYALRGWPGLVTAVAGLLLPSGGVTVLMTAGFAVIRSQPLVQAALKGILPATIGLGLAMVVQMAQPQLTRSVQEGPARLAGDIAVLAGSAALLAFGGVSPALVLLLSGLAALLILFLVPVRADLVPGKGSR